MYKSIFDFSFSTIVNFITFSYSSFFIDDLYQKLWKNYFIYDLKNLMIKAIKVEEKITKRKKNIKSLLKNNFC